MDEHDLIRRLHSAADTSLSGDGVQPDLVAVERGAARVRGRRRWATGVAAAMLVAGAGGAGFGLGQAAGDGGDPSAAEAPGDPVEAPTTEVPPAEPQPAPGPPAPPSPTTTVPAPVLTAVDEAGGVDGAVDVVAGPTPMPYPGPGTYGGMGVPLELRYSRELDDGVRVRVLTGTGWEHGYPVGEWQPAGWCFPAGDLRVTLDGPDLVDVVHLGYYAELGPTGVAAQRGAAGIADGRPLRVLAVQVAPDVASVAVTWPDGATDSAVPESGIAVLVADAGADPWSEYEVTLTTPAGSTTVRSADAEPQSSGPDWTAACTPPPPALPDPGEQPADPAAAEQAVRDDFAQLWADTRADRESARLDDWTGVLEVLAELREGGFADAAASAEHTIDEISFISPTEAWFRYTLDTSAGTFAGRYGTATLGDDGWVFPRAVVCQDVALAGTSCQPAVAPIYPPSWYELNGVATYGSFETSSDGTTSSCTYCTVQADGSEECSDEPGPVALPVPPAGAPLVSSSVAPAVPVP